MRRPKKFPAKNPLLRRVKKFPAEKPSLAEGQKISTEIQAIISQPKRIKMKKQTTVKFKVTNIRMFDPQTSEVINYESTSKLTTPECKEIAKARKLTFIDKTDITKSVTVDNTQLINLNQPE